MMSLLRRSLRLQHRSVTYGFFLLWGTFFASATIETVTTSKQLRALLVSHDYVCLLSIPPSIAKAKQKDQLSRMIKTLDRLSHRTDFELAQVCFAKLICTDELYRMLQQYSNNINFQDTVTLLLFVNAELAVAGSEYAILLDPKGYVQIEDFIQSYIGKDIEKMVEQQRQDRKLARERAQYDDRDGLRTNIHIHYGSPFYYRPYYYWDWPWLGPSYGGFHGGWSHHSGHHGRR
ncbi:hypothetical protein IPH25_04755 [bacterium]|nr:MAG: hypothetical protein IPG37_01750 [bacterium]QQR61750.1 MAG: hypothetical protein IPH25_04755 [bacterium]QQR62677.1 MAG: hypothetical protein IPH67_04655 [bacterium]